MRKKLNKIWLVSILLLYIGSILTGSTGSAEEVFSQEQQRLRETYGLEPPPEQARIPLGDLGWKIGGLSGSFGGDDWTTPDKLGWALTGFGFWLLDPMPRAAQACVLILTDI